MRYSARYPLGKLAASPVGSLFHLTLLDNLRDAFHHGVSIFCSSICWSLTSIGHHMCLVTALLRLFMTSLSSLSCYGSIYKVPMLMRFIVLGQPLQLQPIGVVSCTYHYWFKPYSKTRYYRQLPVSGRRMQCFLQFRHMVCQLSLAVFLGDSMLTGHTGYVFIVEGCPLRTSCTWCMNVQHSRFGSVMRLCSPHRLTL